MCVLRLHQGGGWVWMIVRSEIDTGDMDMRYQVPVCTILNFRRHCDGAKSRHGHVYAAWLLVALTLESRAKPQVLV